MTTAELYDDVCEMLELSDSDLAEIELTRSTLENQLQTILADIAEEGGIMRLDHAGVYGY
jgi:hypothetical protein